MYSRELEGRTLTFGHEGILYKQSFVMYDRETQSLWVHVTGEAVRGPLAGKRLEFVPSVVTTWSAWKEKQPATTVLLGRAARGFMGTFTLESAPDRFGISVGQGDKAKLYLVSALRRQRVVNDVVDGQRIVVVLDPDTLTARAYERGNRTFRWSDGVLKDELDVRWDPLTGKSLDGRPDLPPIPATAWLIERWKGFYPASGIHPR